MYNKLIIIGVIVSLLFTEITNLNAGLIIPGYLALNISNPMRIFWTIIVAFISFILSKGLSQVFILYGRRKYAFMILLSFAISFLILKDANVIGILIPGIIAREFDRQGVIPTSLSIVFTTAIVVLIMFIIGYPIL